MRNEFVEGTTINGRYRLLNERGELADYTMFDVEHLQQTGRRLVMLAPKPGAGQANASLALRNAIMWEMNERRLLWLDLDCVGTPFIYYVVGELTDTQIADLLSGELKLGAL
jgi:hypothetical protein